MISKYQLNNINKIISDYKFAVQYGEGGITFHETFDQSNQIDFEDADEHSVVKYYFEGYNKNDNDKIMIKSENYSFFIKKEEELEIDLKLIVKIINSDGSYTKHKMCETFTLGQEKLV